jgi:hypothetical protein
MNRDTHTDDKAGVELDTRSGELLTGVTLQCVEQGDSRTSPCCPCSVLRWH